ncbi:hypothetical protein Fmac_001580 [Flemingia macrophylla]|uniref:Uncharacterized protein n=1 Tax=Flemingia macrophylla TaxID=520843 RepID=A0ABD1NHH8_9FABA
MDRVLGMQIFTLQLQLLILASRNSPIIPFSRTLERSSRSPISAFLSKGSQWGQQPPFTPAASLLTPSTFINVQPLFSKLEQGSNSNFAASLGVTSICSNVNPVRPPSSELSNRAEIKQPRVIKHDSDVERLRTEENQAEQNCKAYREPPTEECNLPLGPRKSSNHKKWNFAKPKNSRNIKRTRNQQKHK